jgi:hypothetical protein
MDVHVPVAITGALRRRGIDVLTSQEDGTREATDELLLRRAAQLDRVLFTQDHDLLRIVHEWQREVFPGLVFAQQQGMSLGRCIEDLELIAVCCLPDELANEVIFLPLVCGTHPEDL